MQRLFQVPKRLFGSLTGLLTMTLAWEVLIVASLSPLSGPLRPLGLADLLGVDLSNAHRVGRIIMLYHSMAMPFVASLVYLILDQVPLGAGDGQKLWERSIAAPITVGYMLTSLGGMTFAYSGRNWIAHGLYLLGLSLVFYAGLLLAVALWPSRRWATEPARYAHTGGVSLERLCFFLVAAFTLASAVIGGTAGAFFGNGFVAFLAEDVVRQDPHTLFQLMIIAHLHIMLTLIDVAILLLVIRFCRVEGPTHRIVLPMTLAGTVIVTFATWSVIGWEGAHRVINIGSAFLLPGAILVAVWGFGRLIRDQAKSASPGIRSSLRALVRDPVRFGIFFELIFVNCVVTVPGIHVAINLDTYRSSAYLAVERTILVGHWHVLATLSAVLVVFLVADRLGTQGWIRQATGWGLLSGSTLAFIFVNAYMFHEPGQDRSWTVPVFETGITLSLLALALLAGTHLSRKGFQVS